MFNSQAPSPEDLPTSKQLIRSTFFAISVAIVILVGAILPAEYGVDPTGVGSFLGLKKMGEIKVNLEQEEIAHGSSSIQNRLNALATVSTPMPRVARPESEMIEKKPIKKDVVEHTLAPGEAIEFKLEMKQGSVAQYKWSATNGKLNYDTHGDGYRGTKQSISYKKGRMITSDEGEIKAAFDGYHGWFWRNRDDKPVSFKLETQGDYIAFKRMM